MNGTTTAETLALVKDALANGDMLGKSINTGTGLIAYDLQPSAKNLYPAATPIRNVLPRVGRGHRHGHQLAAGQRDHRLGLGCDGLGAGRAAVRAHEL